MKPAGMVVLRVGDGTDDAEARASPLPGLGSWVDSNCTCRCADWQSTAEGGRNNGHGKCHGRADCAAGTGGHAGYLTDVAPVVPAIAEVTVWPRPKR
jgi:hypothetical protein